MILPNAFQGVKITVSEACYEMVPIFPHKPRTKRRLRRTLARFGRLERMNPLAYRTPFGIVMHPVLYDQLKARVATRGSAQP